MSTFAESFWSEDYASGLTKLFTKLNQGVVENEEVINLTRRRAEAEEYHGNKLSQLSREAYRKDGFSRDDGASVRKAFEGMVKETTDSGACHSKIASNLQNMVLKPFGRWAQEHAIRITTSEKELLGKVKIHEKQSAEVKKLRSTYFNKCRLLEDYEEENKLAFPGPECPGTPTKSTKKTPEEIAADLNAVLDDEPVELGDTYYSAAQLKVLCENALESIVIKEVKIPILGAFQNVSTGSAIVEWICKSMGTESLGDAEAIGQDLLNNGFIRYLGVGSTFANSSVLNYQWRDRALIAAGRLKPGSNGIASRAAAMPYVGDYVSTYVTNEYTNETPQQKLSREATQANDAYKVGVRKLDSLRTDMEATIMEHLRFMERCELDRLKALKAVMMDISAAISNVIPGMKSSMDTVLLFQESISPIGDLKYMIESYRSGNFVPKVVTYENYFNSVDEQTFGVDLELRARHDRKRVPNIVATILSHMDEHYPDLANDEERQNLWIRQIPLYRTHQLRSVINNGKPVERNVLEGFDPVVVAATLKLYLLELPDSLVSHSLYEPTKSIFSNYGADEDSEDRVSALSNVLQQLRVSNIATLDAITIHFARLVELTNADAQCKAALATTLGACLIRPRSESSITQQDKHPQKLVLDLLTHRKEIFQNLKRASTVRPRSSTDEKDRRNRMEERNRAISAAGRRPSLGASGLGRPVSPLPQSSLRHESLPTDHTMTPALVQDEPFVPPMETTDMPFDPAHFASGNIEERPEPPRSTNIPSADGPSKSPSLTRSTMSGSSARLSRHGRRESRSLTDAVDGSALFEPRRSTEVHVQREPVGRVGVTLQDKVLPPVQGISLEDGTGDFD